MSEIRLYWKESPLIVFYSIIILFSITFAAFDSVVLMINRWGMSEEYGYAYIIPFHNSLFHLAK